MVPGSSATLPIQPPTQASTCIGTPSAAISSMGSMIPWGYWGALPTISTVLRVIAFFIARTSAR